MRSRCPPFARDLLSRSNLGIGMQSPCNISDDGCFELDRVHWSILARRTCISAESAYHSSRAVIRKAVPHNYPRQLLPIVVFEQGKCNLIRRFLGIEAGWICRSRPFRINSSAFENSGKKERCGQMSNPARQRKPGEPSLLERIRLRVE